MYERRPRAAHQLRKLGVALRLLEEGVDCAMQGIIPISVNVVEYEGDFLEMSDAGLPAETCRDGVEAITVG